MASVCLLGNSVTIFHVHFPMLDPETRMSQGRSTYGNMFNLKLRRSGKDFAIRMSCAAAMKRHQGQFSALAALSLVPRKSIASRTRAPPHQRLKMSRQLHLGVKASIIPLKDLHLRFPMPIGALRVQYITRNRNKFLDVYLDNLSHRYRLLEIAIPPLLSLSWI